LQKKKRRADEEEWVRLFDPFHGEIGRIGGKKEQGQGVEGRDGCD
jgi:hypothetical protein